MILVPKISRYQCKHPKESQTNFRKRYLSKQEISLHLFNISSKVSQLTDWQASKQFAFIWKYYQNIPEISPKNFRKISHPEQEISPYWPNFSKFVSQLMDWQTYKKFVRIQKKCTNISGMCPKNFRKIYHQEQEISLYLSNFSMEVSQLRDWQTYTKFIIIWK